MVATISRSEIRDRINANQRKWRNENKDRLREHLREYERGYHKKNKLAINAKRRIYQKKYNETNREKVNRYALEYYHKNKQRSDLMIRSTMRNTGLNACSIKKITGSKTRIRLTPIKGISYEEETSIIADNYVSKMHSPKTIPKQTQD